MRQPFPRSPFSLTTIFPAIVLLASLFGVGLLFAQDAAPKAAPAKPAVPARPVRQDYPTRLPGDPVHIAHGKQIFGANCAFCHGSDARGGETGPNLVRSEMVLDDQNGELIAPVILNGRLTKGMPAFPLSADDIKDIAAFIHGQPLSSQAGPASAPIDILTGDAAAGKAYFNGEGKCAGCHSVTGDLAGIGSRYEPKILQNAIVAGHGPRSHSGNAPVITAAVTLQSGQQYKGRVVFHDAFYLSLVDADGNHRTFASDTPGLQFKIDNPLQPHIDMFAAWKDSDIHNVTKYLSTLK